MIAINDNFSLLRLPFRREVLWNGFHVCCHKLSYKPAERVQAHSREALLPGYVPVMNDGPGRGVDTKHGVVTLLLEYKGRRKNDFNARTKTRRLRHCQVIWIHLQSLASILKKFKLRLWPLQALSLLTSQRKLVSVFLKLAHRSMK